MLPDQRNQEDALNMVDEDFNHYEKTQSADTIEHPPVHYPDPLGPRITVKEEFIPEPVTLTQPATRLYPLEDKTNKQQAKPGHTDQAAHGEIPETGTLFIPDGAEPETAAVSETSALMTEHVIETVGPSLWERNAVPFDLEKVSNMPLITIVIDDMGLNRRRSQIVADFEGPLTLAYLTYASGLDEQTTYARERGHELMLHVPMEPESQTIDPGPGVLRVSDSREKILENLNWGLSRFEGYVGINNHMGSRFTRDRSAMLAVLQEIKARRLLFLDSRTAAGSAAADAAKDLQVPFVTRNVFLDHVDDEKTILEQLAETERLARKNGAAIAIGHPREATIAALSQWLPGLEERGVILAPISAVVRREKLGGASANPSADPE